MMSNFRKAFSQSYDVNNETHWSGTMTDPETPRPPRRPETRFGKRPGDPIEEEGEEEVDSSSLTSKKSSRATRGSKESREGVSSSPDGNDGVSFVRGSVGTPAGGQGDFTPYGYVSRPGSTPLSYSLWGSSASTTSSEESYRRHFSRSLCRVVFGCAVLLVVLAVLGIVGIAVYLGVLTNEDEGSEFEVRYNGQLKVSRGDTWIPALHILDSPAFKAKASKYEKMLEAVYENSFLRGSLRRAKVLRFLKNPTENEGLHMHFTLALDRRKMPSHVDNTVMAVRDVLLQELMSLEPVAFQSVAVDIDSLQISRDTEVGGVEVAKAPPAPVPVSSLKVPPKAVQPKKEEDVQVIKVEGTQQAPGGAIMIRKPPGSGDQVPQEEKVKITTEFPSSSSTVANLIYEFGPWRPVNPSSVYSPSRAYLQTTAQDMPISDQRDAAHPVVSPTHRPVASPTFRPGVRPTFITGPRDNSALISTPTTTEMSSTSSSTTTTPTTTTSSTTTTSATTSSTTTSTTTTSTTTTTTTPPPATTTSLFNDRVGIVDEYVDNKDNKMTTKRNPSREDLHAILDELLFFATPRPQSPSQHPDTHESLDPMIVIPDSVTATEATRGQTANSGDRLITFQSISEQNRKPSSFSTSQSSSISNTATTVSMQIPEGPKVTSYSGVQRPLPPRPLPGRFPLDRFRYPQTSPSAATYSSSATAPFDIWDLLTTRKPLILNTELVTSTSMDVKVGATKRFPLYRPTESQETTRLLGPVYVPTSSVAPLYRPNKKVDVPHEFGPVYYPNDYVTTDQYGPIYHSSSEPAPFTHDKAFVTVPVISGTDVKYLTVNRTRSDYPNVVIVNLQTNPDDDDKKPTTPIVPVRTDSRRLNTKYLEDLFRIVLENLNYRGVDGASHTEYSHSSQTFSNRQGKPIDLDVPDAAAPLEESKSSSSISLWSVLQSLSQVYLSDPAIIQQLKDFEKASNLSITSDPVTDDNPANMINEMGDITTTTVGTPYFQYLLGHPLSGKTPEDLSKSDIIVTTLPSVEYTYIPLNEAPKNSSHRHINTSRDNRASTFPEETRTQPLATSTPFTTLFMTGVEGKKTSNPQLILLSNKSPETSSTSTTNSPIHTFVLKEGQSLEELLQEIFDKISLEEENEAVPTTEEETTETETTTSESQTAYQTTHSSDERNSVLETIDKIIFEKINKSTTLSNISDVATTTEAPETTTASLTTEVPSTKAPYRSTTKRSTTHDFNLGLFPVMTRPMHPIRYTTTTEAYEIIDEVDNEIRTTLLGTSPPSTTEMRTETSVDVSYSVHSGTTELTFRKNLTDSEECSNPSQYQCNNGECIPEFSRCNLIQDCKDSSDEANCSCADFLKSKFLNRKICDGIVDCWDHSDETNCEWCKPGQFICSGSSHCIEQTQVCDGQPDCEGGDDEKTCMTIAPDLPSANSLNYHDEGYLMVRKKGLWGKLCVDNFETAMAKAATSWSIKDLGQAVCKTLTFSNFQRIERQEDLLPLSRVAPPDSAISNAQPPTYYEIDIVYGSSVPPRGRSFSPTTSDVGVSRLPLLSSPLPIPSSSTGDGGSLPGFDLRLSLEFEKTSCPKRDVVKVSCSSLHCGMRPRAISHRARIVGGNNSGPGSWPWHAALYKEGEYQCGATLINNRWLVSAGHCFYSATRDFWVARLGALRRGTKFPSPYEQLRHITHIFIHPEYVNTGFINDISLLRVNEPISFTDYVRPVCLPPPGAAVRNGRLCTLIGWGQLFEVGKIFPDTLQEVQVPLISTVECRKRTVFIPLYRITEDMFCAGYDRGGRDACLGDSGGPLMCQEPDGSWQLVGVTSNGYGCARPHRPGVYTMVVKYLDWMNQVMEVTKNDKVVPVLSRCNGHRCPLGKCLGQSSICNGFAECSDGSDEAKCH